MSRPLAALLDGLLALLAAGMVAIVSAVAREAGIEPAAAIDHARRRRGRIAGTVAAVVVAAIIFAATAGGARRRRTTLATSTSRLEAVATVNEAGRSGCSCRIRVAAQPAPRRPRDRSRASHAPVHRFQQARPAVALAPTADRGRNVRTHAARDSAGRYEVFADLVHRTIRNGDDIT